MLQNAFQALQSGAPEQAEAISREWLRTAPDHEGGLLLLALSLDTQGRSLEALTVFERLATLYPHTAAHWVNLGNVRRTLGYAASAREAYALRVAEVRAEVGRLLAGR